jgi:hypothetical protein
MGGSNMLLKERAFHIVISVSDIRPRVGHRLKKRFIFNGQALSVGIHRDHLVTLYICSLYRNKSSLIPENGGISNAT